jgi:hypothetical protein
MLLRNFLNNCKVVQFALVLLVSFLFVSAFAKFLRATISFVVSVCPSVRLSLRSHCTSLPPLHGFSLNLIFEYFSEIYWENSSLIEIWQYLWVLYIKTCTFMVTSSSYICHGAGPLVDPFRSHASRSLFRGLFKGLPWFFIYGNISTNSS